MQSSGTVTNARSTSTGHGSRYASVTLDNSSTFKYLLLGDLPQRGDQVVITGVPVVGNSRVNVGGALVRVLQASE